MQERCTPRQEQLVPRNRYVSCWPLLTCDRKLAEICSTTNWPYDLYVKQRTGASTFSEYDQFLLLKGYCAGAYLTWIEEKQIVPQHLLEHCHISFVGSLIMNAKEGDNKCYLDCPQRQKVDPGQGQILLPVTSDM